MNNFFTGMQPSDLLYLGSFLVGGAVFLWLYLNWRSRRSWLNHKLTSVRYEAKYWNSIAIHFDNKFKEAAVALAEKDRVIESVLKESNHDKAVLCDFREMTKERYAQTGILKDILTRVHPYSRLVINNPSKLEAWLERLKGKKAGRKPKAIKVKGIVGGKEFVLQTIKE